jgi:putative hydrolase of the HAD superfamily
MPANDKDFSHIHGVLWDLDNTLYRVEAELIQAFNVGVARAALRAGVPLDMDQAVAAAHRSFEEHGYSGRVFTENYGLSRVALHHELHSYIDEKIIRASHEVRELFATLPHKSVLITHGAHGWAERVLTHLGLRGFFADENILAFEHFDFESKAQSRRAFDMGLSRLNLDAKDVVIVEDTVANLRVPHGMGLNTALIHHGRPPAPMPEYVQHSFSSVIDVLKKLS